MKSWHVTKWYVTKNVQPVDLQIPSLPEGWSLSETPGNTKVSLTREYGNEVIQVDFTARQVMSWGHPSLHHISMCSVVMRSAKVW